MAKGGIGGVWSRCGGERAWIRAAVGIVRSPRTTFPIIEQRCPWVGVFTLVSLGLIFQGLAAAPFTLEAMSEALVDAGFRSAELAPVVVYLSLGLSPVLALFGWLLDAVLIWLLAMTFGSEARFGHAFSLTAHLGIINFLGGLAGFLAFLISRSLGSNLGLDDMGVALGLNLLISGESGAVEVLYSRVNPFGMWFVVVLALGSSTLFRLPKWRSWTVAGIHWTLTTLLLVSAGSFPEILAR